MKLYAVIDTNVLVSAMLKMESVPGIVLQYIYAGNVVPVYNDEILSEYKNVLNRPKFHFNAQVIDFLIGKIQALGVKEESLVQIQEAMPDPKDIVFYSVALAHGETKLVTGNIKHFPKSPLVVSPREFLDLILKNN